MTLSVRSRFEVFKRDSFTCGYCGKTPDDEGVKLEVDHINPRANGGGDELTNLITSCWDCNHGKAANLLGDKAPSLTQAMANTRERALQLDEYRRWQAELDNVNGDLLFRVYQEWIDAFGGQRVPIEDKPGWVRWECDSVGMPKNDALLKHFDVLEVADVLAAIHTTHGKWERGGLASRDVQRYFFGCLKHKREDKRTPVNGCSGDCGYQLGEDNGTYLEHRRIGKIIKNWADHGYESLEDAVLAVWPED